MENQTFGVYLKGLRESKDITLRELARKTGMSAAYISDIGDDDLWGYEVSPDL